MIDPADGKPYTIEDFVEEYGIETGMAKWESFDKVDNKPIEVTCLDAGEMLWSEMTEYDYVK